MHPDGVPPLPQQGWGPSTSDQQPHTDLLSSSVAERGGKGEASTSLTTNGAGNLNNLVDVNEEQEQEDNNTTAIPVIVTDPAGTTADQEQDGQAHHTAPFFLLSPPSPSSSTRTRAHLAHAATPSHPSLNNEIEEEGDGDKPEPSPEPESESESNITFGAALAARNPKFVPDPSSSPFPPHFNLYNPSAVSIFIPGGLHLPLPEEKKEENGRISSGGRPTEPARAGASSSIISEPAPSLLLREQRPIQDSTLPSSRRKPPTSSTRKSSTPRPDPNPLNSEWHKPKSEKDPMPMPTRVHTQEESTPSSPERERKRVFTGDQLVSSPLSEEFSSYPSPEVNAPFPLPPLDQLNPGGITITHPHPITPRTPNFPGALPLSPPWDAPPLPIPRPAYANVHRESTQSNYGSPTPEPALMPMPDSALMPVPSFASYYPSASAQTQAQAQAQAQIQFPTPRTPRNTFASTQPPHQDTTTFSELPPSQATPPPTSSRNPNSHSYPHPHTYPPQRGDTTSARQPTQLPEPEAEAERYPHPHVESRFIPPVNAGPNGIAFPTSTEPSFRPRGRGGPSVGRTDEFVLPSAGAGGRARDRRTWDTNDNDGGRGISEAYTAVAQPDDGEEAVGAGGADMGMGMGKGVKEVGFERDSRWLDEMRASYSTKSISERLTPTLILAKSSLASTTHSTRLIKRLIILSLSIQLLTGALIIAFATAASSSSSSTFLIQSSHLQIINSALGGTNILITGFFLWVWGSEEPYLGWQSMRDLDKFIRKCEHIIADIGDERPLGDPRLPDSHSSQPPPNPKHTALLKEIDSLRDEYDSLVATARR